MEAKNRDINQRVLLQSDEDEEIDLMELFYFLWCHIVQIVLCVAAGAAIAWGVTQFLITPKYEAISSIYIISTSNNAAVDLTDLQIGSQLTADYQELLLSRTMLETVIKNLNLDFTATDLKKMVSIENTSGTRILKIIVASPDPKKSADVANELAKQAGVYIPKIMKTERPEIVDQAVPPESKSSPNYLKNIALGGAGGAVLCCMVLVVRYLMNNTLVTPDDVERHLGIQPLTVIPEENLGNFNQKKKRGLLKKGKTK